MRFFMRKQSRGLRPQSAKLCDPLGVGSNPTFRSIRYSSTGQSPRLIIARCWVRVPMPEPIGTNSYIYICFIIAQIILKQCLDYAGVVQRLVHQLTMLRTWVRFPSLAPFYPIRGQDSLDLVEMHILKLGSYAPQAVSSFQTANMVVVVQLVRTLDCGSRGRVFESRQSPHSLQGDFYGN